MACGPEYPKNWSLHEGMLLLLIKRSAPKLGFFDLRPSLWVWIIGHRVTSGRTKDLQLLKS